MKVLQTISSMGVNAGGPTTCTFNLIKGLHSLGVECDLLTFDVSSESDRLITEKSFVKVIPPPRVVRYGYSSLWKEWIESNLSYDLYHANALWQYPCHSTVKTAIVNNKPCIISTHGMLYPEGLKKSKWIKKLSMLLYQKKDLFNATALHATSLEEHYYLRKFGLKQPIAIIPNAIDSKTLGEGNFDIKSGRRKIGFMGRLSPIKNIEALLEAWSLAANITNDHELVIIGDGDPDYKGNLKKLAKKLRIENISYTGFLHGKEQNDILSKLSYLVLPSLSENFGMVVPEALWRGIPVIASKGTPWEILNKTECGWWVESDPVSLSNVLSLSLKLKENERIMMAKRGRVLIEEKYTKEAVGQMMKEFYVWLLDGGDKPKFVN